MSATSTVNVRIKRDTKETLDRLASELDSSISATIDKAVEELERSLFVRQFHEDFNEIENDPARLAEYEDDMALWDQVSKGALDASE